MNATTTTRPNHSLGRSVRRAGVAAALAAAAFGGTLAAAGPASAASAISFCFTFHDSKSTPYANNPVTLQWYNGSTWVNNRSGWTAANGCGTFRQTPTNVYLRVLAYYSPTWNGATGYASPGGAGQALGNWWVEYHA